MAHVPDSFTTTPAVRSLAIVNPKAGSYATYQAGLQKMEATGGCVAEAENTETLAEALATAERENIQRIIIVGGDGSVSRVVNALAKRSQTVELAIVPAGTGNDFARSLGVPVNDPLTAWEIALRGAARPVDGVALSGGPCAYFANCITVGFGGHQAADVDPQQKSSWGKIAYWLAALAQLGDMPEYEISLTTESLERELRCYGCWITNGRYVGGGFPVSPAAELDDGQLDVVIVPVLPTLELLAAGIDLATSGPEDAEQILHYRAVRVSITAPEPVPLSIDGEIAQTAAFACEVRAAALRCVVGPFQPALSSEPSVISSPTASAVGRSG